MSTGKLPSVSAVQGTVSGLLKQWEFPPVTWVHNVLQTTNNSMHVKVKCPPPPPPPPLSLSISHWGRVTHICVGKLTIIGSDNGLSPGRHRAIIWTNAGILLIGPLGTNFNEFFIGIQTFSFKKMHLKMSSAKWRSLCLGLSVIFRLTLSYTRWHQPIWDLAS